MAVPSSGTLSLQKLAKEKVLEDYDSSTSIVGGIHLSDLVKGGNEAGSPTDYDETNNNSSSKPNESAPHEMSEWYGYDHDAAGGFSNPGSFTFRFSTSSSAACTASTVTVYIFYYQDWYKDSPITSSSPVDIYSSSSLASYATAGWYSNGSKRRYWDGNGSWGSPVSCSVSSATYYYDASTLQGACGSSTAVTVYWEGTGEALYSSRKIFTNSGLTSVATPGYYSDRTYSRLFSSTGGGVWEDDPEECQAF